jgi:threonine/homoserine/homoserine lactone efflux protein
MGGGPHLIAFSVVAAALVVAPGADMALVTRQTLVGGRRAAFATTLGIAVGCLIHAVASSLGLSVILARSALAFEAVKLVGAAYLFALGAVAVRDAWRGRSSREPAVPGTERPPRPVALRRDFLQGALTNLLNPKVALFYLTFLPQFVEPRSPALPQLLLLAGLHIGMGVVWLTAYARGVDQLAGWFARPPIRRWFDGVIGVVLMGLGVRLAVDRR